MGYSPFDSVQTEPAKWEPYYTRLPRQVNGKWYCFRYIWRKEIVVYGDEKNYGTRYIYGDDFDKLKETR